MVHTCVAVGCHNRKTPDSSLSFYRFPRDKDRKQRWIAAVKREGWKPTDTSRLCSEHFVSGKQSKNQFSPDYVPSVFKHTSSPEKRKHLAELAKFEQRQELIRGKRQEQAKRKDVAAALLELRSVHPVNSATADAAFDAEDQDPATEPVSAPTSDSYNQQPDYAMECKALRLEVNMLKGQVDALSITEKSFETDDDKVRFYTGLPNFKTLTPVLLMIHSQIKVEKLSKFQQLVLTLMKMRLNLTNQDLAYRFGVDPSTISRVFSHIVDLLYFTLVPTAVVWPDREELRKTMPVTFMTTYSKCVAIIDCFEVPLEQSSDQDATAQTHSSYNLRNTVKYLIGVAPHGVITFVSKGWGGGVSDQHLMEKSGFLRNVLPGDIVLAERGFRALETIVIHGAPSEFPACTEGQIQLSRNDLERTKKMASVYVHVEKLIGMVQQKYTILNGPVETALTKTDALCGAMTLDKIVHSACALSNLCESVEPND